MAATGIHTVSRATRGGTLFIGGGARAGIAKGNGSERPQERGDCKKNKNIYLLSKQTWRDGQETAKEPKERKVEKGLPSQNARSEAARQW